MMEPSELREHLTRLQLSQTDLAKIAHTTPRTVRRWVAQGISKHATAMFIRDLKPGDQAVWQARRKVDFV